MAHDQLAKFRNIAQSGSIENLEGSTRSYAAFSPSSKPVERLEIRQVLAPAHAPSYRYLMDVSFDQEGTRVILFYSFMMVTIQGQNLKPVIQAILEGTCASIQDFHANEYDAPAQGVPFIKSIDVTVGNEVAKAMEGGFDKGAGRAQEIDRGRSAGGMGR
jgi:hypothetical protein